MAFNEKRLSILRRFTTKRKDEKPPTIEREILADTYLDILNSADAQNLDNLVGFVRCLRTQLPGRFGLIIPNRYDDTSSSGDKYFRLKLLNSTAPATPERNMMITRLRIHLSDYLANIPGVKKIKDHESPESITAEYADKRTTLHINIGTPSTLPLDSMIQSCKTKERSFVLLHRDRFLTQIQPLS